MANSLDDITGQVGEGRNFDSPPLHLWHPELSGDIDIRIDREGRWYHEGHLIEREALVRLFASILRREEDGDYYLVTPVEKWRIQVELFPLMVVDITEGVGSDDEPVLEAILNTGSRHRIDAENALYVAPEAGDVAAVSLPNGLSALCTRAVWYRLVDMAQSRGEETGVESCGQWFCLAAG